MELFETVRTFSFGWCFWFKLWSPQLRLRRGLTAEGGGEEAVPAFSVPHPLPALLPGAEAAQAHETRERECLLHADGRTDGRCY